MGAMLPVLGLAALLATAEPPVAAPDTDPATTAVALAEADTRMTVQVRVNGAGPFRFIVDSGATRTVISRELASTLALPAGRPVVLHSVGGESRAETVRIDRMTLGDLPARGIDAPVLAAANIGAAGILGIDALAGRKVVIDMRRRTMSVVAAPRMRPRAGTDEIVVTARRRFGQLVLADADAAGQKIYAVVDTGSMVTIGNGALRARLVQRRRAAPVQTIITDVTGRQIVASSSAISGVRLGNWRLSGMTVAFSDAHAFTSFGLADAPAMLLGMDMMRAFDRVSIDFRHRSVQLLRPGGGAGEGGPTVRIGA